jgi:hypothetical protein
MERATQSPACPRKPAADRPPSSNTNHTSGRTRNGSTGVVIGGVEVMGIAVNYPPSL